MTPEAQRIAIAEACGWTGPFKTFTSWERTPRGLYGNHPIFSDQPLPDYIGSLDAMHEVESKLSNDDFLEYYRQLYLLTTPATTIAEKYSMETTERHTRYYTCATAAQRAEAFLKTKNLWEKNEDGITARASN